MARLIDLGSEVPYTEGFLLQQDLLKMRTEEKIEDTFLLLEHQKVITIGNSGNTNNILVPRKYLEELGFQVEQINRGGDVTYHGPGQLVGYFIFNIHNYGKGVKDFFFLLEEIFVHLMKESYGIEAHRDKEYPGVWVGEEKITALGCAIKRGISMHGFGFNVNTNLEDFNVITPCGIIGKGVTSLAKLKDEPQDMNEAKKNLTKAIEEVFKISFQIEDKEKMLGEVDKWKKENLNG
ncbi:MAG: lipoyl(octanoyl) transferase [Fusobacteria bacterium]|nr:MAG: lipoyl(octanoyl) transferase [Fusobacteriota bacterium]KAF0228922.1 MAG: lipoyl(octanoyl) [Fusobacteriota bacterium]